MRVHRLFGVRETESARGEYFRSQKKPGSWSYIIITTRGKPGSRAAGHTSTDIQRPHQRILSSQPTMALRALLRVPVGALCALIVLLAAAPPARGGGVALAGTQDFEQGEACYDAEDYPCAVQALEKSAAQKHPGAEARLGYMYYWSKGVTQDFAQAKSYLTRSSDQGYAFGQFWLGTLYRYGRGVTPSDTEAVRLYRLAAAQGEMWGQTELGVMYNNGQGVKAANKVTALSWSQKAAQQGFARAQYNAAVGLYYGSGGVPQDYQQALVWSELAVKGGIANAITTRQAYLDKCKAYRCKDSCRNKATALIQSFQAQGPCQASLFTSATFCNSRGTPTPEDDSVQRVCVCTRCQGGYAGQYCEVAPAATTTTTTTTTTTSTKTMTVTTTTTITTTTTTNTATTSTTTTTMTTATTITTTTPQTASTAIATTASPPTPKRGSGGPPKALHTTPANATKPSPPANNNSVRGDATPRHTLLVPTTKPHGNGLATGSAIATANTARAGSAVTSTTKTDAVRSSSDTSPLTVGVVLGIVIAIVLLIAAAAAGASFRRKQRRLTSNSDGHGTAGMVMARRRGRGNKAAQTEVAQLQSNRISMITNEIIIKRETVLDTVAATAATNTTPEGLYEVEDSSADYGAPLTNARVLLDGTPDTNYAADVTRGNQGCTTAGVYCATPLTQARVLHDGNTEVDYAEGGAHHGNNDAAGDTMYNAIPLTQARVLHSGASDAAYAEDAAAAVLLNTPSGVQTAGYGDPLTHAYEGSEFVYAVPVEHGAAPTYASAGADSTTPAPSTCLPASARSAGTGYYHTTEAEATYVIPMLDATVEDMYGTARSIVEAAQAPTGDAPEHAVASAAAVKGTAVVGRTGKKTHTYINTLEPTTSMV